MVLSPQEKKRTWPFCSVLLEELRWDQQYMLALRQDSSQKKYLKPFQPEGADFAADYSAPILCINKASAAFGVVTICFPKY